MPDDLRNREQQDREAERMQIRLSVRTFVEFLLRSGDIDSRRGTGADLDAMQAGARVHRKIQKSRGGQYRAEVPLKWEHDYGFCRFLLEGRADGICEEDGLTVIEEIKGIYADPERLEEPVPVHLAQARCYAFIYAQQHALPRIAVRMTYVQLETEEVRTFFLEEDAEELAAWFRDLTARYERWARLETEWGPVRDASIRTLPFPFAYRPGQQKLVADIYRTILREKQVFVQAPTGVGKTISAVYPAVRAIGEGLVTRLFYLTAKTVTRTVAEETFEILREKGLRCRTLTLTAKEKVCFQTLGNTEEDAGAEGGVRPRGAVCAPDVCPYAAGHYDRINEVLYRAVTEHDCLDRRTVLELAEEGRVCPYAMQADLTAFADAVIGDYNHVFDPSAQLRQFFGEGRQQTGAVFLIDEAHNLVDRGREMFSADLYREEFLAIRRMTARDADPERKKLAASLLACGKILLAYRKEAAEDGIRRTQIDAFILQLLTLSGRLEDVLSDSADGDDREQLLAFYFRVRAFLAAFELADDRYIFYGQPLGRNDYFLKILCIDPSEDLQRVLDRGRSAVFFSATLVPVRYYRSLLSGREDDYAVAVPSPFPRQNRLLLIGTDVSTRYARRTEEEFRRIARYIDIAVSAKTGNYMVYFPSYQMLEDVLSVYPEERAGQEEREHLVQARDMTEAERERFLAAFQTGGGVTRIGFCVMGGIFAEGIDLYGERLIGAVVVGTGIPQVGTERELLRACSPEDGFGYAYRIPGMNKVLQAAGRVIRTPEDVGWILLLDERFAYTEYRSCFPPSWDDRTRCSLGTLRGLLDEFWEKTVRNREKV